MALIASLDSGVTALKSFGRGLEVIGDNIANVNTVGYKGSRADFVDSFSQYLNRTALVGGAVSPANQVGSGVSVSTVSQDFGQGYIDSTGINSDVALAGRGFFKVVDPTSGNTFATRQGAFTVDTQGNLTTSEGYRVQGISGGAMSYQVFADAGGNLVFQPLATTPPNEGVEASLNVKPEAISLTAGNLSLGTNPGTGLRTIAISSSGQPYSLAEGATALTAANNGQGLAVGNAYTGWQQLENAIVGQRVDESQFDAALAAQNNGQGLLVNGTSYTSTASLRAAVDAGTVSTTQVDTALAAADTNGLRARYFSVTQLRDAVDDGVLDASQINTALAASPITLDGTTYDGSATAGYANFDGLFHINPETGNTYLLTDLDAAAPQVVDFEFSTSGTLSLVMSDGERFTRGGLRLLQFNNEQALTTIGNSLYSDFDDAGPVGSFLTNVPGTGHNGQILQGNLERSNVDLTSEFARMITMQRSFQAGSRIITVSDEILNEAVNLKR